MSMPPYEALPFDRTTLLDPQALAREVERAPSPVPPVKKALKAAAARLDQAFREGADVRQLVHARAWLMDQILSLLWQRFPWRDSSEISLVAVGGYGRGELHPHSDIDLLILLANDVQAESWRAEIEAFVTLLWDLSLDIGHSVRTLNECVEAAAGDVTIATNILESRTIHGDDTLCQELARLAYTDAVCTNRQYFEAKREEQRERHQRFGDTQHNLEPNLKSSPGALRDIQTIRWITNRHFGHDTVQEHRFHFLTDEEYSLLQEGETFLWRLRYGLQLLAGRNENRLLFDYQRSLASLLGYQDNEEGLGVEQMMQQYYRYTLALGEINDVVLQYFDEAILGDADSEIIVPLNRRFQIRNQYIEAVNNQVFAYAPYALLEIFVLMAQHPEIRGIRASTIRAIRAHRHLIDARYRRDIVNTSLFMELLKTPHALHETLSYMKRYSVLGLYLPEFGHIIGKMQYDLFHVYTVDAHILKVISTMVRLQDPESYRDYPLASRLILKLPKIELLYIAGLYHDIGKGRGGDHSELGALDVVDFCKRHHLSQRDTSLVAWLVKNHLLMSMTAQRKDIADPDVIHEFARQLDSQVHLDYLYVLTVCDISATNPNLWNSWRSALLRQLYLEAKRALRQGLDVPPDRQEWIRATQQEARDILNAQGFEDDSIDALWQTLDDDYFLQDSTNEIAWQTAAIIRHSDSDRPLVLILNAKGGAAEGCMQIMVYMRNRDNLFAATTAALEQLNLNIVEARINNATSQFSLSSYVVMDSSQPHEDDARRRQHIKQKLLEQLEDPDKYPDLIRRRLPRQLKHFAFPTEVTFSNDTFNQRTVMEVITPDRPGLLAHIGRILLEMDVVLVNARINTLGERVEDVFMLTDRQGNPLSDATLCAQLQQRICAELDARAKLA